MKYITNIDKETKWELVYCNHNGDETAEDVAQALVPYIYQGKFNADEHSNAGCPEIKNDENIFIVIDPYGSYRLWQVNMSKVTDMSGAVIPHLYRAREIGVLID